MDEPGDEGLVRYQGHPQRQVPLHVLQAAHVQARVSAQQHDHGLVLGGDEAQEEHVPAAAVVALQHRVTEGTATTFQQLDTGCGYTVRCRRTHARTRTQRLLRQGPSIVVVSWDL